MGSHFEMKWPGSAGGNAGQLRLNCEPYENYPHRWWKRGLGLETRWWEVEIESEEMLSAGVWGVLRKETCGWERWDSRVPIETGGARRVAMI